ncbi:MAG: penicillin acylase family protein, partial [Desulfobacterales bacterium]|nr:penicillin acylase family protein [Desulfobacterales bacterium]
KIKELFPSIKEKIPKTLIDIIKKVNLDPDLTGIPAEISWKTLLPNFQASNNWAVSPKKTKSGKAMLCGDPHLETNRLPSIWYETVLNTPNTYVMGVGMPGVPFTVIGRTKKIAWSVTYSFMDVIDYFIEDVKGKKYLRENRRLPFRVRTETIKPKRKKPIVLKFFENDIGVIEGEPVSDGYYLNFAWSSRKGTIAPSLENFIKLPKSKNTKEAMKCFAGVSFGALSWVIADVKGNIGFQMSGNFPKKAKNTSGLLPYFAWDLSQHWKGFISPDKYPKAFNPKSGFIATANQDLNHLGQVKTLSITMGSYRADRIAQRLQSKNNLTIEDMKDMHFDTYSIQAKAFMKIIRPFLPETRKGKILKNWDLNYDTKSKGAMLFERVYEELLKIVFGGNGLGSDVVNYCLTETPIFNDFYANFDQILLKKKSKWFGKLTQKEIYRQAIETALSSKAIPYGKYKKYYMTNIFFGGKLPKFLGFDYGPIKLHGSRATIPQGQIFMGGGRQTTFTPSYRIICDLAEDAIHTNIAGGPLDRRFSKYYTMGIKDWISGRYKVIKP